MICEIIGTNRLLQPGCRHETGELKLRRPSAQHPMAWNTKRSRAQQGHGFLN